MTSRFPHPRARPRPGLGQPTHGRWLDYDRRLVLAIQRRCSTPGLDRLASGLSVAGRPLAYLALIALVLLPMLGTRRATVALLLISTSEAVNFAMKAWIRAPRPFQAFGEIQAKSAEHGSGFPSAHAQNAVAFYGLAALESGSSWSLVLIGPLVGLMLASRVYLGLHFVRDVLAGAGVGLALLGVAAAAR